MRIRSDLNKPLAPERPAPQRWQPDEVGEDLCLPYGGEGEAVASPVRSPTSLAVFLARHVLRDGELVLLILRPSKWHILLSSLWFIAFVLIGMIAIAIAEPRLPGTILYLEIGIFMILGRLTWGVLQWMNRLYILTSMRIVSMSGVFNIEVFDCPLRKVLRTHLRRPFKERLLRLGSIDIIPKDETCPAGCWQTIQRPREVHLQVESAIRRAKQTGLLMSA